MILGLKKLKADYQNGRLPKAEYITRMRALHDSLFEYSSFIKDTSVSQIEIRADCVLVTSEPGGVKMFCSALDERVAPIEILNFGSYEPEEFGMILKLADHIRVVFDIGANIGWYSITLAKMLPKVLVYAFEPVPGSFAWLKKNLVLNNIKNVKPYPIGLSNKNGEIYFYCPRNGSTNASAVNLSGANRALKVKSQIKIMDQVAHKIKRLDFIKCDVEGAELMVFEGGIETLRRHRPIIFTEMLRKWSAAFSYHPNKIIGLLSTLGYRCFTVSGGKLKVFKVMTDKTRDTNFFFLHPKKHAREIGRWEKK